MFEEWKEQINRYIEKHIDRRPFRALTHELEADIAELSNHYTAILLENGVIDENGRETDLDFDEDDLIDAMLDRFLASHSCDGEREVLYAALIDEYLTLVEESSEDM